MQEYETPWHLRRELPKLIKENEAVALKNVSVPMVESLLRDFELNELLRRGNSHFKYENFEGLFSCISLATNFRDEKARKLIYSMLDGASFESELFQELSSFLYKKLMQEDNEAKYITGLFKFYGIVVAKNMEDALQLFTEAAYPCLEGQSCVMHPGAIFMLAKIKLQNNDMRNVAIYLEHAAEHGYKLS